MTEDTARVITWMSSFTASCKLVIISVAFCSNRRVPRPTRQCLRRLLGKGATAAS
jgi:hypothetical protein